MTEFNGFRNGVNLGGWLSQCDYDKDHIAGFITEEDIVRIKSWGATMCAFRLTTTLF